MRLCLWFHNYLFIRTETRITLLHLTTRAVMWRLCSSSLIPSKDRSRTLCGDVFNLFKNHYLLLWKTTLCYRYVNTEVVFYVRGMGSNPIDNHFLTFPQAGLVSDFMFYVSLPKLRWKTLLHSALTIHIEKRAKVLDGEYRATSPAFLIIMQVMCTQFHSRCY